MADVHVEIFDAGPYKVEGAIEIVDGNGNVLDLTGRDTVFLCRCGGSTNKPFCDGTHSKIGFHGAIAAVKAADN